jgi:CTP synthase (UTP-ammonia lyase)
MKLGIIGDYNSSFRPHIATNEVIEMIKPSLDFNLRYDWIPTNTINKHFDSLVKEYNSFWIAPGSPYNSMEGALKIIEYARLNNIPTLGTCGGFQHMVIEFARNVLMIKDAEHAEYDPYASKLVVNPLSCKLAGQTLQIDIVDKHSKTYMIYGQDKVFEKYYCNFGLNPNYQKVIHDNGFAIVGSDEHNEARILELKGHKFFIATLFVPQDNCTVENPHKLIEAFLRIIKQ